MKNKTVKPYATIFIVIASAILVMSLLSMRFLPMQYRLILIFACGALSMLVLLLTKKSIWRYTLGVSMLIIAFGFVLGQQFVDNLSDAKDYEVLEFVVVRRNDVVDADTINKVGYYGHFSKETLADVKKNNEQVAKAELIHYGDTNQLVDDLKSEKIDGILSQSNVLQDIMFFEADFESWAHVSEKIVFQVARPEIVKPVDVTKEPFTVLISGVDLYGDVVTRSRSDMNMIVAVNPTTQSLLSVSLPRDTYIPLGCEDGSLDKLTHAGLYGISCTVKTVENLMDQPINYFVRINFTGLVDIIDILGGVEVYSDNEFTTDSGMHIKKGMNTLDGTQALEFARERYNIESGDLARVANHQALLKGIITKISSSEQMMKIPQLSRYFKDMVDTNLTEDDISKLLSQHLSQNNSWTIHEAILGGTGDMQEVYSLPSDYKYYVYWPNAESLQEIRRQIDDIMTVSEES